MVSAKTLDRVLHYLEMQTESIHPCLVRTTATKPIMSNIMELHWEVRSNVLLPGDQEIHLAIEGVDDKIYDWRFDGGHGTTLAELGTALQAAWERCEAEMLVDA